MLTLESIAHVWFIRNHRWICATSFLSIDASSSSVDELNSSFPASRFPVVMPWTVTETSKSRAIETEPRHKAHNWLTRNLWNVAIFGFIDIWASCPTVCQRNWPRMCVFFWANFIWLHTLFRRRCGGKMAQKASKDAVAANKWLVFLIPWTECCSSSFNRHTLTHVHTHTHTQWSV